MRVRACFAIAVLCVITLVGCGGTSAKVTGTVTCDGKPVAGTILFSPKGEGEGNIGAPVNAPIKDDGTYELRLATTGKHTLVITPRDVKYPLKPGEFDFPCSRAPKEYDVTAGDNKIVIELTNRKP